MFCTAVSSCYELPTHSQHLFNSNAIGYKFRKIQKRKQVSPVLYCLLLLDQVWPNWIKIILCALLNSAWPKMWSSYLASEGRFQDNVKLCISRKCNGSSMQCDHYVVWFLLLTLQRAGKFSHCLWEWISRWHSKYGPLDLWASVGTLSYLTPWMQFFKNRKSQIFFTDASGKRV